MSEEIEYRRTKTGHASIQRASEADDLTRQLRCETERQRTLIGSIKNELKIEKANVKRLRKKNIELDEEMKELNEKVDSLQKTIRNDEETHMKARSSLVSMIAEDATCEFPDSMIREEFNRFFLGNFRSWCSDLCVDEIADRKKAERHLHSFGIINSSPSYVASPQQFKFDLSLSDGMTSLPLLEAALSKRLCQLFLTNPYFLLEYRPIRYNRGQEFSASIFQDFEKINPKAELRTTINWRNETVKCLANTIPPIRELFMSRAKEFVEEFDYLLKEVDQRACENLIELFFDAANLALRLWKTRNEIYVEYMADLADVKFDVESTRVKGFAATEITKRLNG